MVRTYAPVNEFGKMVTSLQFKLTGELTLKMMPNRGYRDWSGTG